VIEVENRDNNRIYNLSELLSDIAGRRPPPPQPPAAPGPRSLCRRYIPINDVFFAYTIQFTASVLRRTPPTAATFGAQSAHCAPTRCSQLISRCNEDWPFNARAPC